MRSLLRRNGVGPDAELPAPPPERDDWWADETAKDETGDEAEDKVRAFEPQPDYWPRPHVPDAVHQSRNRAAAAISPGTRRLLYNASAAGAGWALGLYDQFAGAIADCGQQTSISGALVLGVGGTVLIAHVWDRRTRHWWPGIAWVARIPLATAVLALALWAPAAT